MTGSGSSGRSGRGRAWIMAARPKTLPAAVAPVWVGAAFALARDTFRPLPALAALAGALLIQIGTNLANDYHDFVRGGDTAERVGPTRVTQAGLLEPDAVHRGAWIVFGLAVVVGVYLVDVGGWPVLVVGLASVAAGLAYTAGPFPLAYHGLGDVFVLIFFGPVAVGGTYWVQALELPVEVAVAGLAMGALNTNILVANNLRDLETDARAGKRTLAVRLGPVVTKLEYALLLMLAMAVPLLGVVLFAWTPWSLLALGAAVPAVPPLRAVFTHQSPRELLPALGGTARVAMAYGLLLGVGLILGEGGRSGAAPETGSVLGIAFEPLWRDADTGRTVLHRCSGTFAPGALPPEVDPSGWPLDRGATCVAADLDDNGAVDLTFWDGRPPFTPRCCAEGYTVLLVRAGRVSSVRRIQGPAFLWLAPDGGALVHVGDDGQIRFLYDSGTGRFVRREIPTEETS